MSFPLRCDCGRTTTVTEAMAGTSVPCECGRALKVPSLREMRQQSGPDLDIALSPADDPAADNALERTSGALLYAAIVAWLCVIGLPGLAILLYMNWIAALGGLLVLAGHIWLITQVYVGNPTAALVILMVPILGSLLAWRFIFDYWSIARWPLACQLLGTVVMWAGIEMGPRWAG
jgi:hypothetical protein